MSYRCDYVVWRKNMAEKMGKCLTIKAWSWCRSTACQWANSIHDDSLSLRGNPVPFETYSEFQRRLWLEQILQGSMTININFTLKAAETYAKKNSKFQPKQHRSRNGKYKLRLFLIPKFSLQLAWNKRKRRTCTQIRVANLYPKSIGGAWERMLAHHLTCNSTWRRSSYFIPFTACTI